ncbi:MAG: hypothetical protein HY764_00250 [Candidatus Portnoybacteria bacterium]|nr:hypothetical protein [Candidatus Portnoybacteria bacterium]
MKKITDRAREKMLLFFSIALAILIALFIFDMATSAALAGDRHHGGYHSRSGQRSYSGGYHSGFSNRNRSGYHNLSNRYHSSYRNYSGSRYYSGHSNRYYGGYNNRYHGGYHRYGGYGYYSHRHINGDFWWGLGAGLLAGPLLGGWTSPGYGYYGGGYNYYPQRHYGYSPYRSGGYDGYSRSYNRIWVAPFWNGWEWVPGHWEYY